jgi:hypothetical protein
MTSVGSGGSVAVGSAAGAAHAVNSSAVMIVKLSTADILLRIGSPPSEMAFKMLAGQEVLP